MCKDNEENKIAIRAGTTVLYILLLLFSIVLFVFGYTLYPSNEAMANGMIALSVALGPVSIIGLIYEKILRYEVMHATKVSISTAITKSTEKLENIIFKLEKLDQVSVVGVFPKRKDALRYMMDAIVLEDEIIYIIGTSFRGLLSDDPGDRKICEVLKGKIANKTCTVSSC